MSNWERKMIATNRGDFEVFCAGSGPSICVTHHYSAFNETGDLFAQALLENHSVFLVNLREAGYSDKASEPYQLSMIEAVFDLEAIRSALHIPKWSFAGHSTGGMIGLLYGIHYSRSLHSVILVGTAARKYNSSPSCIYHEDHPNFGYMQELIEQLKSPSLTSEQRYTLTKARTQLSLHSPEKYDDYFSPTVHKTMSRIRMDFFVRELFTYDVTNQLENITVPTLIACGRHDVQCPVAYSYEMHQHIPHSKLYIFENSNHYPFLEESDTFHQMLNDFTPALHVPGTKTPE
ncbi:alpha/beta fold hydrolase [Thalassobacillus sp. CUG 92003]|uniref:alpha/beta fold hydrolase n=1 Tax=Thalassobacillus sp. CUG 92003 TaxID=2736641 RepID=UPI0015E76E52|nr:alpha/beta hydrolase [Thalassobacillus sp. CUG 92003]